MSRPVVRVRGVRRRVRAAGVLLAVVLVADGSPLSVTLPVVALPSADAASPTDPLLPLPPLPPPGWVPSVGVAPAAVTVPALERVPASAVTSLDGAELMDAPVLAPFDATVAVDAVADVAVAASPLDGLSLDAAVVASSGDASEIVLGDGTVSLSSDAGVGVVEVESLTAAEVDDAGFDVVGFRLGDVTAEAASVSGSVSSIAGGAVAAASAPGGAVGPVSVRVDVDYSGFRYVYGGEWAQRLRLVARPGCWLTTPELAGCADEQVLESTNDVEAGVLSAVITPGEVGVSVVPSGPGSGRRVQVGGGTGGDTVYGLSAGYSSVLGSFTATPLTAAASWVAGGGMGGFDWSYPVPVPPSGFGAAPSVGLGYSSQAVDGFSQGENTQGGLAGLGWSLQAGGFIERAYWPCNTPAEGGSISDFCWRDDNATLVLNGRSSEMVKTDIDDGTWSEWRLKDDPGWKVVRQIGFAVSASDTRGEIWYVYTPDGTEYRFGQRTLPDGSASNAVWTVPVFGVQAGEPCNGVANCSLPWRWNVDQVTDTHRNVTTFSYTTETGYYARGGGTQVSTAYTRAGSLAEIRYGGRLGETVWYRDRVTFGYAPRCYAKLEADACAWFDSRITDDVAHYVDAPTDLDCPANGVCPYRAPSFWSKWVLSGIYTEFRDDAGIWHVVDNVVPTFDWPDVDCTTQPDPVPGLPGPSPSDCVKFGQGPQLWLRSIARTGYSPDGASIRVPDIRFDSYQKLDNRGDNIDQLYFRVTRIDDDLGGRTSVVYFQRNPCHFPQPPVGSWQANTMDCFPVWTQLGTSTAFGTFNRWLVQTVTVSDLVAGGKPITTTYGYEGTPGYRYDDNPFAPASQRSYSEPRGYASVTATVGDKDSGYTNTRTFYFRGLDNNRVTDTSVSDIKITYPGNPVPDPVDDHDILRGHVHRVEQYGFNAYLNTELVESQELTWYSGVGTAHTNGKAYRLDVTKTQRRSFLGASANGTQVSYQTSEVDTTFDEFGFPLTVWDRGDLLAPHDDFCVRSEWARPSNAVNAWLLDRQVSSTTTAFGCGSTETSAMSQNAFDGLPVGEVGVAGDQTSTAVKASATGPWLTTTRAFDLAGRVTRVDGPLTTLTDASTTTYDLAGLPRSGTDATGHTTTTFVDRSRGLTLTTTDSNNTFSFDGADKTTTSTYDPLGRLLTVWLPGDTTPTLGYSYSRPVGAGNMANGIARITSTTYVSAAVSRSTYVYVDGLGRTRETQTAAVGGGRVIAATEFNGRGLAIKTFDSYTDAAAPGAAMMTVGPFGSSIVPAETHNTYDGFGRVVDTALYNHDVAVVVGGAAVADRTEYFGRGAISIDAAGAKTYRAFDGRDRLDGLIEAFQTPAARRWSYYYDGGNRFREVRLAKDTSGNLSANTRDNFDWLGRRVSRLDADEGSTDIVYREDGAIASVTDAAGTKVVYERDVLGRVTSIRDGAGTTLESFKYDKSGEAGLLDYASSWYQGGEIRVDTNGYDSRNRPRGYFYTIPNIAGVTTGTGLAGTYGFGLAYNNADQPITLTYPPQGGLAAESVGTGYNPTGQTNQLIGYTPYVNKSTYTAIGQPATREYSLNSKVVVRGYTWDAASGRLNRMTVTQPGVAPVKTWQDDTHTYDATGNLTSVTHNPDGTANDHSECYGYDQLHELSRAFTTGATTTGACGAGPATGGPGSYNSTFAYSVTGNMTTGPAGTATYPGGSLPTRPHAPLTAGATAFTYNADGATATATTSGIQTSYTWNPLDQLTTVTTPTSTTNMVYGPGGQRVLVKDLSGVHLYLDTLVERHYNPTTTKTTEKRYYTLGGTTVSVRTLEPGAASPGYYDHILGDIRGSTVLTIREPTYNATYQWYTPWGAPRGTASTLGTTSRAYIGQHQDPTDLAYLNARYYNPTTGTFLSVDPLNEQTHTPYLYANGNPTSLSDPAGLCPGYVYGVCVTDIGVTGNYYEWGAVSGLYLKEKRINYEKSVGAYRAPLASQVLTGSMDAVKAPLRAIAHADDIYHYYVNRAQDPRCNVVTNCLAADQVNNYVEMTTTKGVGYTLGYAFTEAAITVAGARSSGGATTNAISDDAIIVRGGASDLPGPGQVFSGSRGATLDEAAAGVPHGQIRASTAGEIRAGGGTVTYAPEMNPTVGKINFQHVDVCMGFGSCPFGGIFPNPVPKSGRFGGGNYRYGDWGPR